MSVSEEEEAWELAPFKPRRLTFCNKGYRKVGRCIEDWLPIPTVSLTGLWLLKLGFGPGHVVNVACEHQKITITLAKNQPWREEGEEQED